MIDSNLTSQVQSALAAAQSVLIVLPPKPNFDQVASALGLFLSLSKAGKNASLASPTRMTVEFSSLIGVDQIKDNFQGSKDSLIVSFDYVEEAIEKVSYNIKGGKFHLTIKPKAGHPPLDSQKVEYSYAGGKVDLIITVGVNALKDLGSLYEDNQEAFKESQLINLDLNPRNLRYGQVNLIDPTAASLSEQVVSLIARLRLSVDGDIGSNIYWGLKKQPLILLPGRLVRQLLKQRPFA